MPERCGTYRGSVEISTDDARVPVQRVEVELQVARTTSAIPETLLFSMDGKDAKSTQSVRIVSDDAFQIKTCDCPHGGVLAQPKRAEAADSQTVDVTITPSAFSGGMSRTELAVRLVHKKSGKDEELRIPVLVVKPNGA